MKHKTSLEGHSLGQGRPDISPTPKFYDIQRPNQLEHVLTDSKKSSSDDQELQLIEIALRLQHNYIKIIKDMN